MQSQMSGNKVSTLQTVIAFCSNRKRPDLHVKLNNSDTPDYKLYCSERNIHPAHIRYIACIFHSCFLNVHNHLKVRHSD